MLLKNHLDALVHHLLELLAEEFVLEAHRLGQVFLLPLGELVELLDELFQLLVLDLEILLLLFVCQVSGAETFFTLLIVIGIVFDIERVLVIANILLIVLPMTLPLFLVGFKLLVLLCEHTVERLL